MKLTFAKLAVALGLGAILAAGAFASTARDTECPVCHMALSSTKTDSNPVAVRLKKGDPVMYCCAGCKMPASVLVTNSSSTMHRAGHGHTHHKRTHHRRRHHRRHHHGGKSHGMTHGTGGKTTTKPKGK